MQFTIKLVICAQLAFLSYSGLCDQTLLDRARSLYLTEEFNSEMLLLDKYRGGDYLSFWKDIKSLQSNADAIAAEYYIADVIMAYMPTVSIDSNLAKKTQSILHDRCDVLRTTMRKLVDVNTSTNLCMRFFYYAGDIYRDGSSNNVANLVFQLSSGNEEDGVALRNALSRNKEWMSFDYKIRSAATMVLGYRYQIFLTYRHLMPLFQRQMTAGEFTSFTNELVRASSATAIEKKIIFGGLR